MTTIVTGVEQIRRGFQVMNAETRKRLQVVVRRSLSNIEAGAKSRVPVDTGELRDTIRSETIDDGLVGFVKAGYGKLRRRGAGGRRGKGSSTGRGIYAPVVEFGQKTPFVRRATPFMHPSAEQRKPGHLSEARDALRGAIKAAGSNAE